MKRNFILPRSLLLFLLTAPMIHWTLNSYAQRSTIFSGFTAREKNGAVFLSWTINSGSTCNGISIDRSTDSIAFENIGSIAGVCGSISEPQFYSFTDENPVTNKTNYYRVQFGNTGFSGIVGIPLINLSQGFQVRPNPVIGNAKIYFSNKTRNIFKIEVFDVHGQSVFMDLTTADFFPLHTVNWPGGMYFFAISLPGDKPETTGRFVVL